MTPQYYFLVHNDFRYVYFIQVQEESNMSVMGKRIKMWGKTRTDTPDLLRAKEHLVEQDSFLIELAEHISHAANSSNIHRVAELAELLLIVAGDYAFDDRKRFYVSHSKEAPPVPGNFDYFPIRGFAVHWQLQLQERSSDRVYLHEVTL